MRRFSLIAAAALIAFVGLTAAKCGGGEEKAPEAPPAESAPPAETPPPAEAPPAEPPAETPQ
jgi:hypothetical protein